MENRKYYFYYFFGAFLINTIKLRTIFFSNFYLFYYSNPCLLYFYKVLVGVLKFVFSKYNILLF